MKPKSEIKKPKSKLHQLYKTHNRNLLDPELLEQSQKIDKLVVSKLKKQLN